MFSKGVKVSTFSINLSGWVIPGIRGNKWFRGWLLLFILNTSDSHYSEKTLQHASCCAYSCQCRMYFEQLSGLVHAFHPSQVSTLNIFANCSRRSYSFLNSAACCSVLVSCALGGHYQRKLASNAKYNLQWKSSFVNCLLFVVVWIDVQNTS